MSSVRRAREQAEVERVARTQAALVEQENVELLWKALENDPGLEVTVDLEDRTVSAGDLVVPFTIDDPVRHRLMAGLDDIGITLQQDAAITEFESRRPAYKPVTL